MISYSLHFENDFCFLQSEGFDEELELHFSGYGARSVCTWLGLEVGCD